MDPAKLQKMREVRVHVVKTCTTCVHRQGVGVTNWDVCMRHQYDHGKHKAKRGLPAHNMLVCDSWELHPDFATLSGLYAYATEPWLGSNG